MIELKRVLIVLTEDEHRELASHKAYLGLDWHDYLVELGQYAKKTNYSQITKKGSADE